MSAVEGGAESESGWRATVGPIGALVAVMWLVEIVDSAVLDDWLQSNGIGPRRIDSIDGIVWHPFLHSGFDHLLSNTIPLAVMGLLVALRGRGYWLAITAGSALIGGFGVWLMAGGSNHIGASGVVFGYFGALMGAAWKARRPAALAPALVAIFLYGTILVGLLPLDGISWEGHLAGLLVGFGLATRLVPPPPPPPADDEVLHQWELDEPWRIDVDHPEGDPGDGDR